MIRAVIFDIDGVLLDSFEANLKFFQDLMVRFGYPPPTPETYVPLFHVTLRETIEALTQSSLKDEIQKIWEAGRDRDVVSYPSHLLRTPEKMEETIRILSKRYMLGIATSRVREGVYTLPQLAKLEKYFGAVATYQDTTQHKPNPDPLLFVAKKLKTPPQECVYVGDVENDIIAARAAKMKIIIYSKELLNGADACTSSFQDLPSIVESLE